MSNEKVERALSVFNIKGACIEVTQPSVRNSKGQIVQEGKSDLMEKEFRPYVYHGNVDPNSGAELVGDEEEFYKKGKEARNDRLVGVKDGRVLRAVGSLESGNALLYDANGRPVVLKGAAAAPAPAKQSKRSSPKSW